MVKISRNELLYKVLPLAVVGVGLILWDRQYHIFDFLRPKPKKDNNGIHYDNADRTSGHVNSDGLDYQALADQIFNAEDGCSMDYDAILSVYGQLRTQSDLSSLESAFGLRKFTPCWINHPIDAWFGDDQYVDINRFLQINLSPEQMVDINDLIEQL